MFIGIGKRIKASADSDKKHGDGKRDQELKGAFLCYQEQNKRMNNENKDEDKKGSSSVSTSITTVSSTYSTTNSTDDLKNTEETTSSSTSINKDEQIIKVILQGCPCSKSCLGFQIEGGSDTSLKYICIQSLQLNSPAHNCGKLQKGDQLIMIGDECLIGVTHKQAQEIIRQAPASVEIIAQRKEALPNSPHPFKGMTCKEEAGPIDYQWRGTKMVVELHCNPGEKFGFSIIGGRGDPYLKNIHVNQLKPGGVAEQNHVDPGDCIVSANGHNLTGLSKSEALQVIKAAGDHVMLELVRLFSVSDTSEASSSSSSSREQTYAQRIWSHITWSRRESKNSSGRETSTPKHSQSGQDSHSVSQSVDTGKLPQMPNLKGTPPRESIQSSLRRSQLSRKEQEKSSKQSSKVEELDSTSQQSGPSEKDSIARSMNYGHADSWKIAQQWAPQTPRTMSEEGTKGKLAANFRTPQPSNAKKWHHEAKNSQGEILTFSNRASTLPRKINGSRYGVRLVEVTKGTGFLGMQLRGDEYETTPITVKAILKGGPAYKSGKIHEGDEILEVNGVSFEKANVRQALKFMRKLPEGKVSLILRSEDKTRRRLGCQYQ